MNEDTIVRFTPTGTTIILVSARDRYKVNPDIRMTVTLSENYWWGRPLVPEILDQSDRVGVKSPIFDILSLVAPQP